MAPRGGSPGPLKPFNEKTRKRAKAAAGLRERILRRARVDERIDRGQKRVG